MNAEVIQLYLYRTPICKELLRGVKHEVQRRGKCGLARYPHTLQPHVIGADQIEEWIKRDREHRGEFYGVCDKYTTFDDIAAMTFGG
jgi:hypothetical protein